MLIDNIEDIWISTQSTLSTGGNSIILSTPNGVGNFFHRTWVGSEEDVKWIQSNQITLECTSRKKSRMER